MIVTGGPKVSYNVFETAPARISSAAADKAALILRTGLAAVFLTGGWWKLSRAIDPQRSDALIESYLASDGYINAFFYDYLFVGNSVFMTPLAFMITLSAIELLAGFALLFGLFVRSLSFAFAFLMWTFVLALPVVTAGAPDEGFATHYSPALLVQIRDIGLSGMFFCLLALGSGRFSLDRTLFGRGYAPEVVNMDNIGLLLRLSVAATFLVGGFFAGYGHIKSFVDVPLLLILIGVMLATGHAMRIAAGLAIAVVAYYSAASIDFDRSVLDNANAIKREFAFLAAGAILLLYQGGRRFRPAGLFQSPSKSLIGERSEQKEASI